MGTFCWILIEKTFAKLIRTGICVLLLLIVCRSILVQGWTSGSHFVSHFWVYSFAYFSMLISLLLGVLATVDIQHTDYSLYVHINILFRYFDCTMKWNFVLVISKNRKTFRLYNDWELLWGYKKWCHLIKIARCILNVASLNHSHFECSIIFTSNDCS